MANESEVKKNDMSLLNVLLTLDTTTQVRVFSVNSGRIIGIGKAIDVYNEITNDFAIISGMVVKMYLSNNVLQIYADFRL